MSKEAKILITGAGFVNKGAEALLQTVVQQLRRRRPLCRFYTKVPPEQAQKAVDSGCSPVFSTGGRTEKMATLFLSSLLDMGFFKAVMISPQAALRIKQVMDFDVIVDVSGFSYSDVWGHQSSKYAAVVLDYYKSKGQQKRFLFMPQAWGPFKDPLVAKYARQLCEKADAVYARDRQSYDYLMQLEPKSRESIRIAPDIAFRFESADPAVGAGILNDLGIGPRGRPIVGLVPNMRVYERMPNTGLENQYVQSLIVVGKYFLEETDCVLILIPHEVRQNDQNTHDDRFLCAMIKGVLDCKAKDRVAAMLDDYSAQQIKSVIGHLQLLVGSRYHSLVAALSVRIPVVALGWSHKYVELLQLVGMPNYVFDYGKLEESKLLQKTEKAWIERLENKQFLEKTLPQIEGSVDAVFDDLAEMI
jgi:polysaccharide pyruvyl transferase WcaK-like protein